MHCFFKESTSHFFFFFCMLKKVGITPFATIIVTSVALSVDKVEHAQTNTTVECMLVKNSTSSMVVDIDYLWIGIVLRVVTGIVAATFYAALFEFVCVYNVKRLIIGLSFASALGLSTALTGAALTTWAHAWSQPVMYCGDSGWSGVVSLCHQMVHKEGRKRTSTQAKICRRLLL